MVVGGVDVMSHEGTICVVVLLQLNDICFAIVSLP